MSTLDFDTFRSAKAKERRETSDFDKACIGFLNFARTTMDHHSYNDKHNIRNIEDTVTRLIRIRGLKRDEAQPLLKFAEAIKKTLVARTTMCTCGEHSCEECVGLMTEYEAIVAAQAEGSVKSRESESEASFEAAPWEDIHAKHLKFMSERPRNKTAGASSDAVDGSDDGSHSPRLLDDWLSGTWATKVREMS